MDYGPRLKAVKAELSELAERTDFGATEQARWDELYAEAERIAQFDRDQIELGEVAKRAAHFSGDGAAAPFTTNLRTGNEWSLDDVARSSDDQVVGRAMSALERTEHWRDGGEAATAVLEGAERDDRPELARYLLLAGSPAYRSAFARLAAGESDLMSSEERAAARAVQDYAGRAMALTNVTGKLVPAHLDPSVVLTNAGSSNPIRRIARVEQISTDKWTGVSSEGITAAWATAEPVVVGDDAPSFAAPAVTCEMATAFVPISFQAYEDWFGGDTELFRLFTDAKDRLEEVAFAVGTGTDQPRGIVTALDANTNCELSMATNSAFTPSDLLTARRDLPRRYRDQASYMMHPAFVDRIRQFGTNDYAVSVDFTEAGIAQLLGRPAYESDSMSALLSTATNNAIVYGDFSNFLIADRVGLVVELVQNTFDPSTGRPKTERGWLAHWRTGADSINDLGFRLIQNPAE